MSLSLEINGVDFTSKWRPYESSWTSRAYLGETIQSLFVIDDDDGSIDHLNLASRKIVEVWEDASGTPVCMYRGRVANKTLGRGPQRTGLAMRWMVRTEDYNVDFGGIRVDSSARGEETDRARVLAYVAAYLNGASSFQNNARDTTTLNTTYVVNADLVTLPAETYTDTTPGEVLHRICEISAKNFFAFVSNLGTGQLYYADFDDTTYASDITITDAGSVDGVNSYAPYISPGTGEHGGQNVITGGAIRYGDDEFYEASNLASGETFHDKWEEHFTDEYITGATSAAAFLNNEVGSRVNEQFTYVGIIDMAAAQAHRIKAGMMVPVRLASANKPTSGNQRAVQVTHEPVAPDKDGHTRYKVTIELGVPRGRPFRRNIRRKPTAKPIPGPARDISDPIGWQPGDMLVVYAGHGDNSIPGLAGGFTAIGVGGSQSGMGQRAGYRILQSGDTSLGTWTGQDPVLVWTILRGQHANPIGKLNGGGGSAATFVRYFALDAPLNGANSRVLLAGQHGNPAATMNAPTGYTTLTTDQGTLSTLARALQFSDAQVSSFAQTDVASNTVGNGYQSTSIEIIAASSGSLKVINSGYADNGRALPAQGPTPDPQAGDLHADLVGDSTSNRYATASHPHHVFRTTAPTTGDDVNDGYPEGTLWIRVNSLATPTSITSVHRLLDNAAGAAVWVSEGLMTLITQEGDSTVVAATDTLDFGVGFDVTESPVGEANIAIDLSELTHNTLGGLTTGDPHTQYVQEAEFAAKGDLLGGTGPATLDNLSVGADGTHLRADSSQTTGLKWSPKRWAPMTTDPANNGNWVLLFTDGGDVYMSEVEG